MICIIMVAQVAQEELWMSCMVQSTGRMQYKVYNSLLMLPQDLHTAFAFCIITLLLALLGLLVYLTRAKCTSCTEDKESKAHLMFFSGIIFVISRVLTLIPICWTAHTIIQDFYNLWVLKTQKPVLGTSSFGLLLPCLPL